MLTHLRVREARRETYPFTEAGECLLTGRSIRADLDLLNRYAGLLVLAGAAVLALGLGGGAWFTRRALRPLDEISAAAKRISAGNLSEHSPGSRPPSRSNVSSSPMPPTRGAPR